MVTYKTIIDMVKQPEVKYEFIKGDTASRQAFFTFVENGNAYDLSDMVDISVKILMPDGTVIYSPCTLETDEDDNIIGASYEFSSEITKVAGKSAMQLILTTSDSSIVSTSNIFLIVKTNVFDEGSYVTSDDLSTIQSYLTRALAAATTAEEVETAFENAYAALENITEDFEEEYDLYVAYLADLQEKVTNGYFNGAQGPAGSNGADAVVTDIEGAGYAFQIVDGDLVIYYWTEDEPGFSLSNDGDLLFSYGE